ncbi:MAG TPA: hypothetical protein VN803_13570, partial [Gemmatimonadales bacterium]|nr:hypothetical protein [Gemmatimonadales bacterium]
MTGILRITMAGFAVLAVILLILTVSAWRRRHRISSTIGLLTAALCGSLATLSGAVSVGIGG